MILARRGDLGQNFVGSEAIFFSLAFSSCCDLRHQDWRTQTIDVKTERKLASQDATLVQSMNQIGNDSLLQKTPVITPKLQTVQSGDTFEDTPFKPWFAIVKTYIRL
jgi:hypothetical protein